MPTLAGAAELVRSNQKDIYYISWLKDNVSDIVRGIIGSRIWIRWRRELQILTEIAYFGLTTLSGYQTLGEEYCYIVQVNSSQNTIPSFTRRLLMVSMSAVGLYLLEGVTKLLERELNFPRFLSESKFNPRLRSFLNSMIPVFKELLNALRQIHTIAFYFNGIFYHLSKRFVGIKYVLIRAIQKDSFAQLTFWILGWLSVVQLVISIARWYQYYANSIRHVDESRLSEKDSIKAFHNGSHVSRKVNVKCCLCLELCDHPTCTPCGHIFCWKCIAEWCRSKPECPLCRETTEASRLVHLHHYSPT